MSDSRLNLLAFSGRMRILHLSWIAFFLSFLVWFSHAPLLGTLREAFGLSDQQIKTLLILNVALTIPARILIGMLVDAFGPRRVYALLLLVSGLLCLAFAAADSYQRLALIRFLLGVVGASFVIGIRLISEWFPARQLGLAEGIYGGWGNFGAAVAALVLPALALAFGGPDGWRYAIGCTGLAALAYAGVFYLGVRDAPPGSAYVRPGRNGAMEVSSAGDLLLYALVSLPLALALALIVWKLGPTQLGLLGSAGALAGYGIVAAMAALQLLRIWQVNGHLLRAPAPAADGYRFKQVALLNLAYLATFGSELAVVSILPLYFQDTFALSPVAAGLVAGSFMVMNLFARPGGGLASDRFGRRRALAVALAGVAAGYLLMSRIDADWPLALAVAAVVACSLFVQAGCGSVYAAVPLVRRRLTGQVAGMVGAYGNVGGVLFLTVLSLVSVPAFFTVLGLAALACLVLVLVWMDEPSGQGVEETGGHLQPSSLP